MTSPASALDLAAVDTAFQRMLDLDSELASIRVTGAEALARGVSRETWRITAAQLDTAGNPRTSHYIVRRDHPGGSQIKVALRFEFDVYDRLWSSAIPVARALWFEDDPTLGFGGRPYYVREQVDGDWRVPHFHDLDPRYDELRIATSKEHISKLALIHTCDWRALNFDAIMEVPTSEADCALTALRRFERDYRSATDQPVPLAEEAIHTLRVTAPRSAPAICLLKGTNGFGEEVFRDGQIVALSDWELAGLGDPAYDFALLQDFLPVINRNGHEVWGEAHALDYYAALTGIRVDPANIAYYRRLYGLIRLGFALNTARSLLDGTDLLARRAWVSTQILFKAQYVLAQTAGLPIFGEDPSRAL